MPTSFLRFSVYVGAVFSAERFIVIARAFALLDPYGLRCLLSEKAEMLQNPRKCQKSQGDTIFPNFIIFYRLVGGGDVNAHVSVLIF